MCECCHTPGCCLACCCPCCIYGQILAAMRPEESPCCGGNFCGACCLFCFMESLSRLLDIATFGSPIGSVLCPISSIIHRPTRGAIRRKYNIAGDELGDCFVVWCCTCCALAQVCDHFTFFLTVDLYILSMPKPIQCVTPRIGAGTQSGLHQQPGCHCRPEPLLSACSIYTAYRSTFPNSMQMPPVQMPPAPSASGYGQYQSAPLPIAPAYPVAIPIDNAATPRPQPLYPVVEPTSTGAAESCKRG